MKRTLDEDNLTSPPVEDIRVDNLPSNGIYSRYMINAICHLYDLTLDHSVTLGDIYTDASWNPYKPANLETDGKFPSRGGCIIPIIPRKRELQNLRPIGNYGFVIPVAYCIDDKNDRWIFSAMKTSINVAPSLQEAAKTLSYSNAMEDCKLYPSIGLVDAFSILNPDSCPHCDKNELEEHKDEPITEILNFKNLHGSLPPSNWWMFWWEMTLFCSDSSRSELIKGYNLGSFIDNTKVPIEEEEERSKNGHSSDGKFRNIDEYWESISLRLDDTGRWQYKIATEGGEAWGFEDKPDKFMRFTIPYDVYETLRHEKKTSSCITWPRHVSSSEFGKLIWEDMIHKFSVNKMTAKPRADNNSRSRSRSYYAGNTSLPEITYIIPFGCMCYSFMFTELVDSLLFNLSNMNDGFTMLCRDMHVKVTPAKSIDYTAPLDPKRKFRDIYKNYIDFPQLTSTCKAISVTPPNIFDVSSSLKVPRTCGYLDTFKKKRHLNRKYQIAYLITINKEKLKNVLLECESIIPYTNAMLLLFWENIKLRCIEEYSHKVEKEINSNKSVGGNRPKQTPTFIEEKINKFLDNIQLFNHESLGEPSPFHLLKSDFNSKHYLLKFTLKDMIYWYPEALHLRFVTFIQLPKTVPPHSPSPSSSSSSSNRNGGDLRENYNPTKNGSSVIRTNLASKRSTAHTSNNITTPPIEKFKPSSSAPPSVVKSYYPSGYSKDGIFSAQTVKRAIRTLLRTALWMHVQVVRGIHSQGIIHGDLHDLNILVFSSPTIFRTTYSRYGKHVFYNAEGDYEISPAFPPVKRRYIVPAGCGDSEIPDGARKEVSVIDIDTSIFPEIVLIDFATAEIKNDAYDKWCFEQSNDKIRKPRSVRYASTRTCRMGLGRHAEFTPVLDSSSITVVEEKEPVVYELLITTVKEPYTEPSFRSPEQTDAKLDKTRRNAEVNQIFTNMSDIYSVGMTMFSLIAGYNHRSNPFLWSLDKKRSNINSSLLHNPRVHPVDSLIPRYGVNLISLRSTESELRSSVTSLKYHFAYDLEDGYFPSSYRKLCVTYPKYEDLYKDFEENVLHADARYTNLQTFIEYDPIFLEKVKEYIKKNCIFPSDKWIFSDTYIISAEKVFTTDSGNAVIDSEEANNLLDRVVKRILGGIDSLGLPKRFHTELLSIIEKSFKVIESADKKISKDNLIKLYDIEISKLKNFTPVLHKMKKDHTALCGVFGMVSKNLCNYAVDLLKREKDSFARGSSLLRDFILKLKRCGWVKHTLKNTLQKQFGFLEMESIDFSELIESSLSWGYEERPSCLELSHSILFDPLKKTIDTWNHLHLSSESHSEYYKYKIVMYNMPNIYSSDHIPQTFVSEFKNMMHTISERRGDSSICKDYDIQFISRFFWFLPSLRYHALKENDLKRNLIFLDKPQKIKKFIKDFPLLSAEHSGFFYDWNILSGRLSMNNITPLYNPIKRLDTSLMIPIQLQDTGEEMIIFFCNSPNCEDDTQKDEERVKMFTQKLQDRMIHLYKDQKEEISSGIIGDDDPKSMTQKFRNDYPWIFYDLSNPDT